MSDDIDLKQLKRTLSDLSDDQLIEMVTAASADYRREALDCAKAELRSRGIDWSQPEPEELETESDSVLEPDFAAEPRRQPVGPPGLLCPCGGQLRKGTLVAEKELTIIFNDNREERFVLVTACIECGQVSLLVDYDTELEK